MSCLSPKQQCRKLEALAVTTQNHALDHILSGCTDSWGYHTPYISCWTILHTIEILPSALGVLNDNMLYKSTHTNTLLGNMAQYKAHNTSVRETSSDLSQAKYFFSSNNTVTHIHTRLTALCPGLPRWASTRKVKPIRILLKQETVRGSGISWAYANLHITPDRAMPVPHHSSFLQAGYPSCCPTNSVKSLKAVT